MICPKCRASNEDDYVYCVNCGLSLSSRPDAIVQIPPAQRSVARDQTSVPESVATLVSPYPGPPANHTRNTRSKTPWIIGAAFVLIVLIGGVIGVAFLISKPIKRVEALPDHFGLFLRDKNGNALHEIKRFDVVNSLDAKAVPNEDLPGVADSADVILYADTVDIPISELKCVPMDSILPSGTVKIVEFQVSPIGGNPAMKRIRFPHGLVSGRYAFILFDGHFDEGKHRLWPFQINESSRANNDEILRDWSVALKEKQTLPVTKANSVKTASGGPSITAPIGARVGFCNATDVTIRSGPGLSKKKIGSLKRGQKLYVIEYSDNYDDWKGVEANWAFVQTEGGKRGWVFTPFIGYD
ncbi:MAG: SH3 domain-containing protein [Pyrinomonadaceae bacterium]